MHGTNSHIHTNRDTETPNSNKVPFMVLANTYPYHSHYQLATKQVFSPSKHSSGLLENMSITNTPTWFNSYLHPKNMY